MKLELFVCQSEAFWLRKIEEMSPADAQVLEIYLSRLLNAARARRRRSASCRQSNQSRLN